MTTLMNANRQWSMRPADERYGSVAALHAAALGYKDNAKSSVVPTAKLRVEARGDDVVLKAKDIDIDMTNFAFGQLCKVGEAPSGYLAGIPAPLAAECLNHGLRAAHGDENGRDNRLLFNVDKGMATLRALTSERYARIWNSDITARLLELEELGPWQPAPAAFDGSRGLYLGDRDMFAFMVDNDRRIFEKGPGGGLSRGFFASNSEVGAASFRITTFFYNYVCGNHMVWGASGVKEVSIRHVGNAKDKAWAGLEAELVAYADSSSADDELKVAAMLTYKIGNDLDEVLDTVMGLRIAGLSRKLVTDGYNLAVQREDWYGAPNTMWGLAGGLTEIARDLPNADDRTTLEAATGKLMEIAF